MAECLDLVLGIVRHRRRATFQFGVCAAEGCANGAVAGLDILAVDVHGWRRVNWFVERHVLAQECSWGCGCGLGDSSFGITFFELVLIGIHADQPWHVLGLRIVLDHIH